MRGAFVLKDSIRRDRLVDSPAVLLVGG